MFPLDPDEWVDGDGVADVDDLFPNDPTAGIDADGDGTPDVYDLNPGSAAEARFQVVQAEPSGATATIVSDGLIVEDEVVITPEPVDADNGISGVAASEIIDFTIDGPSGEFETARKGMGLAVEVDGLTASPFNKVAKLLENGLAGGDSVASFVRVIPTMIEHSKQRQQDKTC